MIHRRFSPLYMSGPDIGADICAASLEYTMQHNYTFESQRVCLEITRKSKNELFSTNFEGKCANKLVELPKLKLLRDMSKVISNNIFYLNTVCLKANIASVKKKPARYSLRLVNSVTKRQLVNMLFDLEIHTFTPMMAVPKHQLEIPGHFLVSL